MNKILFWDLDGTLTESGEGITKSVQYALEKIGKPEPDLEKLKVFIGPPLLEQFMAFAGVDRETAELGVKYYRERYSEKGIFENSPYPGIPGLLGKLREKGFRNAVASSKPEFYVNRILEHYDLAKYFEQVAGATMDGKRTQKYDVIMEALKRTGMDEHREQVIMIGDREHDVLGARQAGIPCIAVTYGYGTEDELKNVNPLKIVDSVEELEEELFKMGV